MTEILRILEDKVNAFAERTRLNSEEIGILPPILRELHKFKIFGADVLAIPANCKIKGNDDEPEIPFRFIDSFSEIELFEKEFRSVVPSNYVQFGYLYGANEIVVLDSNKLTVHFFHVSDVADKEWLSYKLGKDSMLIREFLSKIRPQTIACFINPNNYSEYDIIEIQENNKVVYGLDYSNSSAEYGEVDNVDEEAAWDCYLRIAKQSQHKGFELNYGPKKLKNKLGLTANN